MKTKRQKLISAIAIVGFTAIALFTFGGISGKSEVAYAKADPTPTPAPVAFDQAAAIAKLKEQIKGKEQEPAEKVFKNIQNPMLKSMPAARILGVMEFGYARSLGVDCSHCHIPDKWESDERVQKQITREMAAMAAKINGEMLKGIKNLKSETPIINCTTCHRGQVKPATSLPPPPKA